MRKNWKSTLLLALLTLATAHVKADDVACRNVDLRNDGSLGYVRNQGHLGWCFAYAAADIYGHALGQRISPFDIAINYYRDRREYGIDTKPLVSTLAGGKIHLIEPTILLHGTCLDKKFSAFRKDAPATLVKIEELANRIAGLRSTGDNRRREVAQLVQQNFLLLNQLFPTTQLNQLVDSFLNLDPRDRPLVSLADNICGDRIPMGHLERYFFNGAQDDHAGKRNFIRRQLAGGKRPVLIGYNAGNLKEPTRVFDRLNHASVIVGMRSFMGQCQYLLKNSWGTPNRNAQHWTLGTAFNSDGDFTWIPEHMLTNMAREIHFVKRRY